MSMYMYKPTEKPTATDARLKAELMATTANAFADFTINASFTSEDFNTLGNMIMQLAIMAGDVAAMLGVVDGYSETVSEYYTFYDDLRKAQEKRERKPNE